ADLRIVLARPQRFFDAGTIEGGEMDLAHQQARIDAITWYHEFDFGNGLKARSKTEDVAGHRTVWRFMEEQMDKVDFRNKTVLDIGCWDGYWSFYAERRGAKSVLATDDRSQNWADGRGLLLAKELYGSSVQVNQDLSVYQLASLNQRFDIILFLGVYYHLHDPFYAFAQIRHCCHRDTIVLVEGNEALSLGPNEAVFNFPYRGCEFLPTFGALEQLLQATYFTIATQVRQPAPPVGHSSPVAASADAETGGRLGWRWRLRLCAQTL